jgi:hypothetical protein
LKENWLCENTVISILDCVECFKYKLTRAREIEQANLKQNQVKMKQLYDKDAMIRKFKSGEKVIVLLLIRCHPLHATYCWPFVIESRLHDLNYIVNTPTTRKKRQICQVTTQGYLKEYKLTVDASDVGVGALLLQEGKDDIDLPNCYLFLKGLTTIRTNNPQLIKTAF